MLKTINLQNFRSYEKREFEFGPVTIIIGDNGAGKSNLIEAVYMLATGKSFRADSDSEMVRYGEQLCVVGGETSGLQQSNGDEVKVILAERKKFEVNGVPRRQIDFVGKLRAVLFGPADMELITGSPGNRRRYLDFVISQADREYRRCLISYEKGLRQRNKLLDMIRDGFATRSQLFFWDRLLIKDGEYITTKRSDFLARINTSPLTPLLLNERGSGIELLYDKSVISEPRLKQYEVEEVAAGTTLVGPHRDDFTIMDGGRDVSKFGSRGEQRMMLLKLKLWERDYLSNIQDSVSNVQLPVLLLDDVFSELDHRHREEVMKLVSDHTTAGGQVIMTTADKHLLPEFQDGLVIQL